MKKGERTERFIDRLQTTAHPQYDPCYVGYFLCFNEQQYYEAHDVLEHIWLQSEGEEQRYFKGLIQLAGAFVHLKKQFARPDHAKDGRRIRPAWRLLRLAEINLTPFAPRFMGFEVDSALRLCHACREQIEESGFEINPWNPGQAPRLELG
jgi:hypothetical protein